MVTLMKADGENTNTDPMFKIAYEKMEPVQKPDSAVNYFNEQNYWLYRTHITIEHMTNSFYSSYQSDETLKVLKLFLDKLQQLELVKQLAHLIAMKNALFLNMNRQIDKQQANNMKLSDLVSDKNDLTDDGFRKIVKSGAEAFLTCIRKTRQHLSKVFNSKIGSNVDFSDEMFDIEDANNLPLSYLLPSTSGNGRYIYILLYYLSVLQNEMLYHFNQTQNDRLKERMAAIGTAQPEEIALKSIDIENINKSSCINFKIEKDLLRIIYIHSNYSLVSNKNLNFEYNFAKIQSSIEDKILNNKPTILTDHIRIFEFADDLTDINRLRSLNNLITQEEITQSIKYKINQFYKQPNQITNVLKKLRVILDLSVTSGNTSNIKIMQYAIDVLKMKVSDDDDISRQIYDLDMSNLKSLWISLSLHRSILLTQYKQDPFDRLSDKYKKKYQRNGDVKDEEQEDQEAIQELSGGKSIVNRANLKSLLGVMFELITFKLIPSTQIEENSDGEVIMRDSEDEANYEDMSLHNILWAFIEDDILKEELIESKQFHLEELKGMHTFYVWKLLVKMYSKKN